MSAAIRGNFTLTEFSPHVFRMMMWSKIRWAGHVTRIGENRMHAGFCRWSRTETTTSKTWRMWKDCQSWNHWHGRVKTGYIWLRIKTSGGLLWKSVFRKMTGNPWICCAAVRFWTGTLRSMSGLPSLYGSSYLPSSFRTVVLKCIWHPVSIHSWHLFTPVCSAIFYCFDDIPNADLSSNVFIVLITVQSSAC